MYIYIYTHIHIHTHTPTYTHTHVSVYVNNFIIEERKTEKEKYKKGYTNIG